MPAALPLASDAGPDAGPGPLYLYALLPPGLAPGIGEAGVAGAPVAALAMATATLLVSPAPEGLSRSRRNLLAHARVVEAALAAGPVLPVRFGMVAAGAAPLAAALRAQAGAVTAEFARLSGRVEVGLRLQWEREAALAAVAAARPDLVARRAALPAAGQASYQARIALGQAVAEALERVRAAAAARILAAIAPHIEAQEIRAAGEDVEVLRADLLLRAEAEPGLAAAVEAAVAAETPALALRYVGPGPCWSFCRLALGTGPWA